MRPISCFVAALVVALGAASASAAPIVFAGQNMQTNGSATLVGATLRLTQAVNNQAGSAWTSSLMTPHLGFSTAFTWAIGGAGGDGFTFGVQSAGTTALGGTGQGLGYTGISPSVAVTFDEWDNEIRIYQNGAATTTAVAPPFFLSAGGSRFGWVDYDRTANLLSVYVNVANVKPAVPNLTYTVNLGTVVGPAAYIGFTAGTGFVNATHDIQAWSLLVNPEPGTMALFGLGVALAGAVVVRRRRASLRTR